MFWSGKVYTLYQLGAIMNTQKTLAKQQISMILENISVHMSLIVDYTN